MPFGGVEDENPEDYTKNKKLFPIIFPIAIEQKNLMRKIIFFF